MLHIGRLRIYLYHTPGGNRILLGAERSFFTHTLAMIVDLLADDDAEFGIAAFDELRRNQKLYALYSELVQVTGKFAYPTTLD